MKNYFDSLQILRALAAVSVVYYHVSIQPVFGSFGVDIFFVLSGFIMAMVVDKGQTLRDFVASRLIRILPLYWILTTCLLAVALVKPSLLNSTTANLENYAKSLLFIPYFKESGALRPMLAVGWTLNYEMFFYACIAVSLFISKSKYFLLTILLLASSHLLAPSMLKGGAFSSFLSDPIIWEFAFGMCVFRLRGNGVWSRLPDISRHVVICISLAWMAYAEFAAVQVPRQFLFGLPSCVIMLLATTYQHSGYPHWDLVKRKLIGIGDASYATYLCHYYVVEGVRKSSGRMGEWISPHSWLEATAIIVFSLIVGHLLHTRLDVPVRRWLSARFR
jgi:exopolysaccharide production protein ExoZ